MPSIADDVTGIGPQVTCDSGCSTRTGSPWGRVRGQPFSWQREQSLQRKHVSVECNAFNLVCTLETPGSLDDHRGLVSWVRAEAGVSGHSRAQPGLSLLTAVCFFRIIALLENSK